MPNSSSPMGWRRGAGLLSGQDIEHEAVSSGPQRWNRVVGVLIAEVPGVVAIPPAPGSPVEPENAVLCSGSGLSSSPQVWKLGGRMSGGSINRCSSRDLAISTVTACHTTQFQICEEPCGPSDMALWAVSSP